MPFLKKFFKRFSRISIASGVLAVTMVFSVASVADAQAPVAGSCLCYCGDSRDGAKKEANQTGTDACAKACTGLRKTFVGCFQTEQQSPENDNKCWTEEECAKYATDLDGNEAPGTWGGQSAVCSKTRSNDATGYCYGPSIGVKLNVPILGRTTVFGFHEYLALAYKFLLPAMSLIAVVMIMVGGLEYVVSGGSSKRVEKAKTRITNAVIGLIILLSAYSIASLLDSRLVNLKALKTPLLKRLILLDPNSTCETLSSYKFDINPKVGTCGDKDGTIEGIENVTAEAKNSNFKPGDKCKFSRCTEGLACLAGGDGKYSCLLCPNINTAVSPGGITPSPQVCAEIQKIADANDKNIDHKYFCTFDDGGYGGYGGINTCVSAYTAGAVNQSFLDCKTIESDARTGDPCLAYDKVNILHPKTLPLNAMTLNKVFGYDFSHAINVCVSDPCGVAARTGNKCGFSYIDPTAETIYRYIPFGAITGLLTGVMDNHCVSIGGYKPPPEALQQPDSSGPGNFSTP